MAYHLDLACGQVRRFAAESTVSLAVLAMFRDVVFSVLRRDRRSRGRAGGVGVLEARAVGRGDTLVEGPHHKPSLLGRFGPRGPPLRDDTDAVPAVSRLAHSEEEVSTPSGWAQQATG